MLYAKCDGTRPTNPSLYIRPVIVTAAESLLTNTAEGLTLSTTQQIHIKDKKKKKNVFSSVHKWT